MINIAISLFLTISVFVLLKFPLNFSVLASIFPSMIIFAAAFIILARKTFKKFEVLIYAVQSELQRQSTIKNPKMRSIDKAIDMLKAGYPLSKWQIFIKSQIDAQIGVIYYTNDKTKKALPYLQNAFLRHWVSKGMLSAYYYKDKKYDEMKTSFETAIKANKKVALLYNMYAWCLNNLKENDKALSVLQKGIKILPNNQELKKSLNNIQNNKPIKLKGYGDEWYQFRLEKHPNELLVQKPMFKTSKKQRIQRR